MTGLQNACRKALCGLIRVYQYTLSPWIGRSCRRPPHVRTVSPTHPTVA